MSNAKQDHSVTPHKTSSWGMISAQLSPEPDPKKGRTASEMEASHEVIIVSSDSEEDTHIPSPKRPRVVLDSDKEEPAVVIAPAVEEEAPPLEADDDVPELIGEKEGGQLDDTGWLKRVIRTLLPLSRPVGRNLTARERFVALKKQWFYSEGNYAVVPSLSADCGLCEHKRVSYLFTIENTHTGENVKVASECIHQFRVRDTNRFFLDQPTSRAIIDSDIAEAKAVSAADIKFLRSCIKM